MNNYHNLGILIAALYVALFACVIGMAIAPILTLIVLTIMVIAAPTHRWFK